MGAKRMGLANVEFREGLVEDIPVADAWADVVIGNGVINPCADKKKAFEEIGHVDVRIGAPCDTFGGASGEKNARVFEVYGDPFLARKPK
jgi:hypothetical protein